MTAPLPVDPRTVRTAAAGVLRANHWVYPNGRTRPVRTVLIERPGSNLYLRSGDLSHAAWSLGTGLTVAPNVVRAPDGTLTAARASNTGAVNSQGISQVLALTGDRCGHSVFILPSHPTASGIVDFSIYDSTAGTHRAMFRATITNGVVVSVTLVAGSGTPFTPERAPFGWWRCGGVATGIVSGNFNVGVIYPTGGGQVAGSVHLHWPQVDNGPLMTAPLVTAGSTLTRAEDTVYAPLDIVPGPLSVYARWVEYGTKFAPGGGFGIFALGSTDAASLSLIATGLGTYQALYRPASGDGADRYSGVVGSAVLRGDLVEVVLSLAADGVVRLSLWRNGGAEEVATATGAGTISPRWALDRLYLGRQPHSPGSIALTHALVARGSSVSRDTFRALARVVDP